MSLLVLGAAVAGAAAALGISRSLFRRRSTRVVPVKRDQATGGGDLAEKLSLPMFGFEIDDVVVLSDRELVLAGAWLLGEPEPRMALYFAFGMQPFELIIVDRDGRKHLLRETHVGDIGSESPLTLEYDGAFFERTRRLPLRAITIGEVPSGGEGDVVYSEYAARGELLVVIARPGALLVAHGRALPEGTYDLLRRHP